MTEERDLSKDPKVQEITEELQDYYEKSSTRIPAETLESINRHLNLFYESSVGNNGELPEQASSMESILGTPPISKTESAASPHPIEKFMSAPVTPSPAPPQQSELDIVFDQIFTEEPKETATPKVQEEKIEEMPASEEAALLMEEGDYLAKAQSQTKLTEPVIPQEEEDEISSYLTNLFGEIPREEEPLKGSQTINQEVPAMTEAKSIGSVDAGAKTPVESEAPIFSEELALEEPVAPAMEASSQEETTPDPLHLSVIKAHLSQQASVNSALLPINHYMMGVLSELDKKVGHVRGYFQARRKLEEMYHDMQNLSKKQASIMEVLKIAEEMVNSRNAITASASAAKDELAEVENVARLMKETADQFLKAVQDTKEQINKDILE